MSGYAIARNGQTLPDLTGNAFKALTVNPTETGVIWSSTGTGTGDMQSAVYDPAGGAKQVAFATDISGKVNLDQTTPQTIGDTTNRLAKLWANDVTVTNTITGSVSGNAATVTTNANLSGHVTSVGNTTSLGSFTVAQLNTAISDADVATGGGTATGTNTGDNSVNTLYSGLVTNATHTGDATGSGALTVVGINGTNLSLLSTGILKNTTTTGVPSIATGADLPVMTATVGGAVPTPPNNTTTYLRGDGTFATPTGNGDMILANVQTVTGEKIFDKDKLSTKGTSTGKTIISNANTSANDYTATLQAATGTIALTSDIPAVTGFVTKDQTVGQTIGDTTNRLTKLWATDITATNAINGSVTGNAATVTTNANLTGEVTSVGNATTVTNASVIGKLITGFSSGSGVLAGTDTILQAINKLDGNIGLKQNALTNPVTGTGTTNKLPKFTGTSTIGDGYDVVNSVGSPGTDSNIPTEKAVRAAISTAGGGDVSGPAVAEDGNVVLFNGSTGKLIKDGGYIAESTSNKENTIINTSTTKYPTVNLLNTGLNTRFNYLYGGITSGLTYTDNGDGTINIPSEDYVLFNNATFSGIPIKYTIGPVTNLALTDNTNNYVVADYNLGTPIIRVITNVTLITESDIIPVYTIYRNGIYLHVQPWTTLGLGLTNKLHQSIVKTQRYRRESGLAISEFGTRNINLTSGIIWTGANGLTLDTIDTSLDNCFFNYHVAGVWTSSIQSQYNNTQYDNGTGLQTLSNGRYAVNWIYRGVELQKHLYIVLGSGDFTLAQAQVSQPPSLPSVISSHAVLCGRIIVQKNASTATQVDSAFSTVFASSATSIHNDLSGIQGGVASEYYHLNSAQQVIATQAATTTLSGYLTSTDWNTFNGKQAGSTNLTSLSGLSYVSGAFVKMTGANTFTLDTSTYLTSLAGAVLTNQTTPQTIGLTGTRLAKLWTTDITCTNAIAGSVTGNAGTATKIAATKNIYGNAFDGSADLTQVIASTYGGTGNGFTKFAGPASTEKTITLPNANETFPAHGTSGNIMVSNGTIWTSAAPTATPPYAKVDNSASSGTITLATNTITNLTTTQNGTTFTLTLGTAISNYGNEYVVYLFTGATAPTITFPANIVWSGTAPTIAINTKYLFSFLKIDDTLFLTNYITY